VHTRLEFGTTTVKALQTASYLTPLLQNGHIITVLCQDDATGEAAQSAADYYYFLVVWSFGHYLVVIIAGAMDAIGVDEYDGREV
jgi:hypothetical protein